jgi:hypothetical protein
MTCPKCNIDRAHRSHRKGLRERLFILGGRVPYRCHQCGERFLIVDSVFWKTGMNSTGISRQARRLRILRELSIYGLGLIILLVVVMFLVRDGSGRN